MPSFDARTYAGAIARFGVTWLTSVPTMLALVARGYTNKQFAEALYVTEKTARNHVSHILEKLGLSRRSEAAAYAVEYKLVPPREQRKDEETDF